MQIFPLINPVFRVIITSERKSVHTKSFDQDVKNQSQNINFDWNLKTNSERIIIMSNNNKTLVPEAKEALNKFKMEAAAEVGVNLKQGYNGNLTSREAGSVGGQMVKKMVESYENSVKNNTNG